MSLVHVEFDWSDEFGFCYDCGRPAAYEIGHSQDGTSPQARLRCSVCAASAAWEGEELTYLFEDRP